jgi:hypothetical protein
LGAKASSWKHLATEKALESRFEGDSLGFGFNEFTGIRSSHGTEEIGCWVGFGVNQKLGGKLLSRENGRRNLK